MLDHSPVPVVEDKGLEVAVWYDLERQELHYNQERLENEKYAAVVVEIIHADEDHSHDWDK